MRVIETVEWKLFAEVPEGAMFHSLGEYWLKVEFGRDHPLVVRLRDGKVGSHIDFGLLKEEPFAVFPDAYIHCGGGC